MPDVTVRGGREQAPPPAIRSSGEVESVRLKVCGITEQAEMGALAANWVEFAGLWYAVPGGPADLELQKWEELVTATAATDVAPVLVTFSKDAEMLREALESAPVKRGQLHGYQTP